MLREYTISTILGTLIRFGKMLLEKIVSTHSEQSYAYNWSSFEFLIQGKYPLLIYGWKSNQELRF